MKQKKKSFVLHLDSLAILDELTNEQAGLFIKGIKFFKENDKLPDDVDLTMKLVLIPFINQFKRDDDEWNNSVNLLSQKGLLGNLKRWHPDLYTQVIDNQLELLEAISIAKNRQTSPPDTTQSNPIPKSLVSVSVNDSANDSDIANERKKLRLSQFKKFWDFYNLKVEKSKSENLFLKLKDSDLELINKTLPNYIKRTGGDKPSFRKNPSTYLYNKCWLDEQDQTPLTHSLPNYAP